MLLGIVDEARIAGLCTVILLRLALPALFVLRLHGGHEDHHRTFVRFSRYEPSIEAFTSFRDRGARSTSRGK